MSQPQPPTPSPPPEPAGGGADPLSIAAAATAAAVIATSLSIIPRLLALRTSLYSNMLRISSAMGVVGLACDLVEVFTAIPAAWVVRNFTRIVLAANTGAFFSAELHFLGTMAPFLKGVSPNAIAAAQIAGIVFTTLHIITVPLLFAYPQWDIVIVNYWRLWACIVRIFDLGLQLTLLHFACFRLKNVDDGFRTRLLELILLSIVVMLVTCLVGFTAPFAIGGPHIMLVDALMYLFGLCSIGVMLMLRSALLLNRHPRPPPPAAKSTQGKLSKAAKSATFHQMDMLTSPSSTLGGVPRQPNVTAVATITQGRQ
ncbi:hypothetical protein HK105_201786 [Polyrhizophydium stewartii]|uniref:Uncharacterized protein n=1 Tax=Polyrhizophydium stewartii TaxID=2732419 RepID=A0ABR4NFU9_9FUNG